MYVGIDSIIVGRGVDIAKVCSKPFE